MFEYISKFEENPYRKVDFAFVRSLLIECGSIGFECKLNWFIAKCLNGAAHHNDVTKTDVWEWIERLHNTIERASLENDDVIINANLDSFSDDLDDITDYLIERAND